MPYETWKAKHQDSGDAGAGRSDEEEPERSLIVLRGLTPQSACGSLWMSTMLP